jgi:hypothetical protein
VGEFIITIIVRVHPSVHAWLRAVRIPDDADQRSGLMPITHSERCRSVIPGDADHSFRGDPDQLITMPGMVIAIPGTFSTGRSDAGHHRRQAVSPI